MKTLKIVDELGIVNTQLKALEETARKLKQELIARGIGIYQGKDYFVEVQHYDKEVISPKLVRELADEDFVKDVTQIQSVDAVVVKPLSI
jgi:hypothetical protein